MPKMTMVNGRLTRVMCQRSEKDLVQAQLEWAGSFNYGYHGIGPYPDMVNPENFLIDTMHLQQGIGKQYISFYRKHILEVHIMGENGDTTVLDRFVAFFRSLPYWRGSACLDDFAQGNTVKNAIGKHIHSWVKGILKFIALMDEMFMPNHVVLYYQMTIASYKEIADRIAMILMSERDLFLLELTIVAHFRYCVIL